MEFRCTCGESPCRSFPVNNQLHCFPLNRVGFDLGNIVRHVIHLRQIPILDDTRQDLLE